MAIDAAVPSTQVVDKLSLFFQGQTVGSRVGRVLLAGQTKMDEPPEEFRRLDEGNHSCGQTTVELRVEIEIHLMQLAQQLKAILSPPLAAVVHHGNVRQIVKHQPFAMRSDGPVQILVEEEVVLVETTDSLLVVHGAAAHVKCGTEEGDRKDSIQSRWQEDDPEGRPEL